MIKTIKAQLLTERGLIYFEAEYSNREEAQNDGYSYMFTSSKLGKDVYGKTLDNKGLRHECVLVERTLK